MLARFSSRIQYFREAWSQFREQAETNAQVADQPDQDLAKQALSDREVEKMHQQMHQCLYHPGGEISAKMRIVALGDAYLKLLPDARVQFLRILALHFDVDHASAQQKITLYQRAQDAALQTHARLELLESLTSPRIKLLKKFTSIPQGFTFLVDLRADVLAALPLHPELWVLDYDLQQMLVTWFDVGMVDLIEIDWNKTPASMLDRLVSHTEKVAETGAAHSFATIKDRLNKDRKLYAFIHSRMQDEPLVFMEVAFMQGMQHRLHDIIHKDTPITPEDKADTAVFYSVTNVQPGLQGIPFGNFLINRVIKKLKQSHPHIVQWVTLSPVPGFVPWLRQYVLHESQHTDQWMSEHESHQILQAAQQVGIIAPTSNMALNMLLDQPHSLMQPHVSELLEPLLMRLCAYYLLQPAEDGKALDPVARFHLFNGARIERLQWLADTTNKGLAQSAGIMVNYCYDPYDIEEQHEQYILNGRIASSRYVRSWL